MNIEQMRTIMDASCSDVDHLAALKSSMGHKDFKLLSHQELSKYVNNPKVVSFMVDSGNNTYELSMLLKMQGTKWYSNAIKYFCLSFRDAFKKHKNEVVDVVESNYPIIHESLANYHDSYFLQNQNDIEQPRHLARAYFRMMGDTIESVHLPHIQFIYQIMVHAPDSPLYGRPLKVSNGKAVSELLQLSDFVTPFITNLENVSLNQWRNISQHSSYKYDSKTDRINCTYGNNKDITLSPKELESLMIRMDVLQSMLKICIEFPLLEFMEEFKFDSDLEITIETLLSQLGNAFSLNGYSLLDIKREGDDLKVNVKDNRCRGIEGFKVDFEMFKPSLMLLMHNGISTTIELFDSSEKSIQKAYIQHTNNG